MFQRPDGTTVGECSGDATVLIGRGEDAAIRIDDRSVSRTHARVTNVGGRFRLADLDSASGVEVNGMTVSQVVLKDGDVVRFGDVELHVRLDGDDPAGVKAASSSSALRGASTVPGGNASAAEISARPASSAGSEARPPYGKIGAGVAAVIVVFVLFRVFGGDGGAPAKAAYERGAAAEARGDHQAAALAFDEAARQGKGAFAIEARSRAERAQTAAERKDEALSALAKIAAGAGSAPLDELEARLRGAARRYVDVLSAETIESEVSRLRDDALRTSARTYAKLAAESEGLSAAGFFAEAAVAARRAASAPELLADDAMRAAKLAVSVDRAAVAAFELFERESAALPPAERFRSLDRAVAKFAGTAAETPLKEALRSAERASQAASVVAVVSEKAASAPIAPPKDVALRRMEAAALAFAGRDYAKAAVDYAAAAADGAPAAGDLALRAGRLRDLRTTWIEQLNAAKSRLRDLALSDAVTGSLASVDAERFEFDVGPGAKVRFLWSKIEADRLWVVLERLPRTSADERALAEWWVAWNEPARALAALARAVPGDPELARRDAALVAEARGIAVPEGGFALYDGRFLTRDEEAEARLTAALESGKSAVVGAKPGAFSAAADGLSALGPRGREALIAALRARTDANVKTAAASPLLKGAGLEAFRARLFAELELRRTAALALIMDEKKYPYPYAPDQETIQAEVDRLIDAVREVWRRPSALIFAAAGGAKPDPESAALAVLDADQALVAAAAKGFEVDLDPAVVRSEIDRLVAMSSYAPDAKTKKLLEDSAEIEAYNLTRTAVIGEYEREVHRLTNAYRLMMGRRSVMIDDRLVTAARGHSEEMSALKYFAHDSPTPGRKSPSDRAKLAGFGGGVSENIARGQPLPVNAVEGWIGSSGHHRNILGAGHTLLGVGYCENGRFWTQNFGRGALKPPKDK